MAKIKLKRGNFSNIAYEADEGELLTTLDTHELFIGKGSGQPIVKIGTQGPQGPQGENGSGGLSLYRYTCSSSPYCRVTATGLGVDITINELHPPQATIIVPNGVEILSASVYFTSIQIGTGTGLSVVLPSYFGIGNAYYARGVQTFRDTGGSRGQVGTTSFNTGQNIVTVSGLVANMNYVCRLTF